MRKNPSAARVARPLPRLSVSGFLLLAMFVMPLAAHAQGGSPFDTGFTAIQTLFTGTIAKVSSLIAIVIGGYVHPRVAP
jgi:type IV secretory pathway VirB2 component (pilin)